MSTLVFQATLGGQINLNGANTASSFDIAVPATTGTIALTGSTLTSGRVPYSTTGGILTDASGLTFDGTTLSTTGLTTTDGLVANTTNWFNAKIATGTVTQGYVLVGSATPYTTGGNANTRFQVHGNVTYNARLSVTQWNAGGATSAIYLGKSNSSTIGTQAAVASTTVLGGLYFEGSDGTALQARAYVAGVVDNTVSAGVVPTSLVFYTGTSSTSEAVRIDSNSNVGIGTSAPNASAILDAQSTTKGVRMPNMTTTQKNAISSPAAGLMVFDTTLSKLCVYSGSAWQTITSV